MTFKLNWEKTNQHVAIQSETVTAMVKQAFPNQSLLSHEIIPGGCANLNIKIIFDQGTYILRVYLRDQEAPQREASIAHLLKYDLPIPEVLFIGDQQEDQVTYRFSIMQFKEGIPLRDLLLQFPEDRWKDVMEEVGEMLSECQRISFPHAGFIDGNLTVSKPFHSDELLNFVTNSLNSPQVQAAMGESKIQQLREIFQTQCSFLPDESNPCLVHGDFDPANILVHEINGQWKVSAILDWEFSFAGSWLWDVANMLRYAHHMPACYEDSFIRGLEKGELILPDGWCTTISLMNIVSLLELLSRETIHDRPIMRRDICELIEHMLQRID